MALEPLEGSRREVRPDGPGDIVLHAVELMSKAGFEDGDILDDLLDENGFDSLARPLDDEGEACLDPCFGGAVLCEAVRRHLAPKLIGFEIGYDMSIAHNPVRLADMDAMDHDNVRGVLAGVSARLSEDDVLAIARELADRFPGARTDSPALPPP